MPLSIIRQDITKLSCDAIVNAAGNALLGGGGVDGAIHAAAGPRFLEECKKIGGCPTGEARITKGYNLPCRYVIHTVGPIWQGGQAGEEQLLRSCYQNALKLAVRYRCKSVAFSLISGGIYGYPKDQALQVAMDEIGRFLMQNDMQVYIVVFDRTTFQISQQLFSDVKAYIDDVYWREHHNAEREAARVPEMNAMMPAPVPVSAKKKKGLLNKPRKPKAEGSYPAQDAGYAYMAPQPRRQQMMQAPMPPSSTNLNDMLKMRDESFTQMLLRLIDEREMKDSECYKKANIDRKLFSKIRKNPQNWMKPGSENCC